MRTHESVITEAGGPTKLGKAIGVDGGVVKQWRRLNSIPAPHWRAIVDAGHATLDELADAAASRRTSSVVAPQDAAA